MRLSRSGPEHADHADHAGAVPGQTAAGHAGAARAELSSLDRIELRGLRVVAAHGALPEELSRSQPFELDIEMFADLSRPGASDLLAETVDYGKACAVAAAELAGAHADLLEHLAWRVAGSLLSLGGVVPEAVRVTVRKLRPPVPADLSSAAVTLTRHRGE